MMKMFKMKNLSLFLALGLVGLMYHTPNFLRELTNGLLGKVLLVVALAYITVQCDFSCAVIFALITTPVPSASLTAISENGLMSSAFRTNLCLSEGNTPPE